MSRNILAPLHSTGSPALKSFIIVLKKVYSDLSNRSMCPTRTCNNELRQMKRKILELQLFYQIKYAFTYKHYTIKYI